MHMQTVGLQGSPLSFQQARFWSWQKNSAVSRTLCAVQIQGALERERFKRAVGCVIERHEILRTVFAPLPGMDVPIQVIRGTDLWSWSEINLERLEMPHRLSAIDDLFLHLRPLALQADGDQIAFNLESGPLFSLWLFRYARERHIMLVSLPTLCADSSSMKLFIDELVRAYAQQALPEEVLQYADVSAWQQDMLQEEDAKLEREYWRKIDLSSINALHLPFEQEQSHRGNKDTIAFVPSVVEIPLPDELVQQIERQVQHCRSATSSWMLGCWQVLLWRLSHEPTSVMGVACDGRSYTELTNAMGLYQRFVPIRADFVRDRPFEVVLASAHGSLQEARKRQLYFCWEDVYPPVSGDAAPPFFPLSFEYESWPETFDAGEATFSLLKRWNCIEPFLLKLNVLQVGERLSLELHYDPQWISLKQASSLANLFHALLLRVTEQPQLPVGSLPLLPADEHKHLLTLIR